MLENVQQLIKKIKQAELTVSCCESASGGALASLLCETEGASSFFKGGIIAYSNEIKVNVVKIPQTIIDNHGAISEPTAKLMSENANRIFKTDICIAITGNSSAVNTIENQPSCFYYVAITIIDKTYVEAVQLEDQGRNFNRLNIAYQALTILDELLNQCLKG